MRRTEALQGVRMAVFLNILNRWESAEPEPGRGGGAFGGERADVPALDAPLRGGGEAGLCRSAARQVPVDRAEEVRRLHRERYQGFTVKHFHAHLVKDHGFGWGYTWIKLHLQWMGVVGKAPRKGAHRRRARACRHNRYRGGERLPSRRPPARPQRPFRGSTGRRRLGLHAHSRRRPRRDPVRRGGAAGRP